MEQRPLPSVGVRAPRPRDILITEIGLIGVFNPTAFRRNVTFGVLAVDARCMMTFWSWGE
ncbi:hypothetical protein ABZ912_25765 [Nonomuraea angiospora]|uniref:hypothetical protein n=1 Tax=Nonomuraea angiospora TaxID=46172 RepID=UPI0033D6D52D